MDPEKERRDVKREGESSSGEMDLSNSKSTSNQLVPWNSFQPGLLHGLMTEVLYMYIPTFTCCHTCTIIYTLYMYVHVVVHVQLHV